MMTSKCEDGSTSQFYKFTTFQFQQYDGKHTIIGEVREDLETFVVIKQCHY